MIRTQSTRERWHIVHSFAYAGGSEVRAQEQQRMQFRTTLRVVGIFVRFLYRCLLWSTCCEVWPGVRTVPADACRSLSAVHGIPKVHFKGKHKEYYIMVRHFFMSVEVAVTLWFMVFNVVFNRSSGARHMIVRPALESCGNMETISFYRLWTFLGRRCGTCGIRRVRSCLPRWLPALLLRLFTSSRTCTQRDMFTEM